MSLLLTEGFETYGSQNDLSTRWSNRVISGTATAGSGSASVTFVAGRYAGSAARLQSTSSTSSGFGWNQSVYFDQAPGGDLTTVFVGMGYKLDNFNQLTGAPFMQLMDSNGQTNLELRFTSGFYPYLTRNNTTLCTSSRAAAGGLWSYYEIGVNFSSTAGWCELWMDGSLVASYYGTGATRALANGNTVAGLASMRTFRVGYSVGGGNGGNWSHDISLDDVYLCSSAGTRNNNILIDPRIITLLPNAASADGSGAHTQFSLGGTTPAATNWQSVNETALNSDVNYVQDNTVGQLDTYQYPDLPSTVSTVLGVVMQHVVRKDDAGARQLQAVVRQSGSDSTVPGSVVATAAYLAMRLPADVNPATGLPWTVSDVNGAEFGYRVSA
jgi:hypothetical protein